MEVSFGICADLHTEFIHDAPKRMKKFIDNCRKQKLQFCVNLGDFCSPGEMNSGDKKQILDMIDTIDMPFYHILGNHDIDENSKKDVLDFLNADEPHGSFDCGGVHFILLDACHYRTKDEFCHYDHGNYKAAGGNDVPYLPPEELEWLKNDLEKAKYPSVIFSHQSLIESRTGIRNPEDVRAIFRNAPNRVIMAICGHEHVDRVQQLEGTWYVCINSMSYYWAGESYDHETYGAETEASAPDKDTNADLNNSEDFFAMAILNRTQVRDSALEVLREIADNPDTLPDAKEEALSSIAAIADDMSAEANIETLIEAKGISKCVAVISGDSCSIIVNKQNLAANELTQITDIVYEQTGIPVANITVVEAQ